MTKHQLSNNIYPNMFEIFPSLPPSPQRGEGKGEGA